MTTPTVVIDTLREPVPAEFEPWLAATEPEWFREYFEPSSQARGRYLLAQFARAARDATAEIFTARGAGGVLLAAMVVCRLDWDSRHFGIECARIGPYCLTKGGNSRSRLFVHEALTERAVDWSVDHRLRLLQRRLLSRRIDEIRCLEARGFRLADNIVTLTADPASEPSSKGKQRDVAFRPANTDDLPALVEMTRDAFPHSRFVHDPVLNPERGRAVYVAWLEAIVTGDRSAGEKVSADTRVIVCTIRGEIGGYAVINRDPELDALLERRLGLIELFVIAERFRGRGLGSGLLRSVLQQFAGDGVDIVEASTWINGKAALGLYQKAGFSVRENLLSFHYDLG